MKTTKLIAIVCLALMTTMSLGFASSNGSAATIYNPTWGADLLSPTAIHSARMDVYDPSSVHNLKTALGVNAVADGLHELVSSEAVSTHCWVETAQYFLPARMPSNGDIFVLPVAPDNSTIQWVWATAVFTNDGGYYPSNIHLNYSIDSGQTWSNLSTVERTETSIPGYRYVYWNITSMQAWTPAMVKSVNLFVMVSFDVSATIITGPHSRIVHMVALDYIGLTYLWYTPGGWYPVIPTTPTNTSSFQLSMEGTMNVVGLIGLAITPAAAVWVSKQGDHSRLLVGIAAIVFMSAFLGLLLF